MHRTTGTYNFSGRPAPYKVVFKKKGSKESEDKLVFRRLWQMSKGRSLCPNIESSWDAKPKTWAEWKEKSWEMEDEVEKPFDDEEELLAMLRLWNMDGSISPDDVAKMEPKEAMPWAPSPKMNESTCRPLAKTVKLAASEFSGFVSTEPVLLAPAVLPKIEKTEKNIAWLNGIISPTRSPVRRSPVQESISRANVDADFNEAAYGVDDDGFYIPGNGAIYEPKASKQGRASRRR